MKETTKRNIMMPLLLGALMVGGTGGASHADSGPRGESAVSSGSAGGGAVVVARDGGRGGYVGGGRGGYVGSGRGGYVGGGRGGYVGGGRGGYVGRGGYGTHYAGPRHGHSHSSFSGSIWIGPGWGFYDPFFYPYYPYPSYRYYTPPTVVVPQEPQEYILPETQQPETGYWYYCRKPEGFYPYVERCPSGWMRVVPNTTPPDQQQEDKEDTQ